MKPYQLALIAAATAICGCDHGDTSTSTCDCNEGTCPDGSCSNPDDPHKKLIEDNGDGFQVFVYTGLGLSQCHMAGATLQVQEGGLQLGPMTVLNNKDTSKGFYLAWSVCNPSNVSIPKTSYNLVDTIIDGNPLMTPFNVPADPQATELQPCICEPQIVFINVPAGGDRAIALVDPTERITDLGAGFHLFTLSAPFDTPSTIVQVQ